MLVKRRHLHISAYVFTERFNFNLFFNDILFCICVILAHEFMKLKKYIHNCLINNDRIKKMRFPVFLCILHTVQFFPPPTPYISIQRPWIPCLESNLFDIRGVVMSEPGANAICAMSNICRYGKATAAAAANAWNLLNKNMLSVIWVMLFCFSLREFM